MMMMMETHSKPIYGRGTCLLSSGLHVQVAQLSQRDRATGWVSYGQKWKTGTGKQYYRHYGYVFNHNDIIGQQNNRIR